MLLSGIIFVPLLCLNKFARFVYFEEHKIYFRTRTILLEKLGQS